MKPRQFLIFILLTMSASLAFAGFTQAVPVNVDLTTLFAEGDQWTARLAPNETEFIGCGVRKFDDGAGGARCGEDCC